MCGSIELSRSIGSTFSFLFMVGPFSKSKGISLIGTQKVDNEAQSLLVVASRSPKGRKREKN